MRIAIIAHGLSNGGAERVASLVANHYVKAGHTVLFVAVYSETRAYVLDEQIKYVYAGSAYKNKLMRLYSRSKKIDSELKKFRADVAVSFIRNECIYSMLKKTAPFIYTLRNDPAQICSKPLDRICSMLAFGWARKNIFQTPSARAFFSKRIQEKSIVIANPLTKDLPLWKGTDNCEKTIVTACRLIEQKNLPMLISAFSLFSKKYPEYTLKIYGDGNLLESLKCHAKACGVEDTVFFPGYASNIHEIMSNSAMFAMTSNFEGLSNSMLEALAIGVPTVCTDCPPGGAAMYIEDGVSGMLVPVGDTEALTEKLCQMAEDARLCRKLSENARKIRDTLDADTVLSQWENVLSEIK